MGRASFSFREQAPESCPIELCYARMVSLGTALASVPGAKAHQGGRPPPPIVAKTAIAHVARRNMTLLEHRRWTFFEPQIFFFKN